MAYSRQGIKSHVIDCSMKKYLYIVIIISLLYSCKYTSVNSNNDEVYIVNKALSIAKPNYIVMNIVVIPDNDLIVNYKNGGFQDEGHNIYYNIFNFRKNKTERWSRKLGLYNSKLEKRVNLIEDYSKIIKVSHNELEKSITILSISNVMFSDDGKFAIVNIGTSSNTELGDYEGQMYVFKKEGNEWVYQFTFMTAIS